MDGIEGSLSQHTHFAGASENVPIVDFVYEMVIDYSVHGGINLF